MDEKLTFRLLLCGGSKLAGAAALCAVLAFFGGISTARVSTSSAFFGGLGAAAGNFCFRGKRETGAKHRSKEQREEDSGSFHIGGGFDAEVEATLCELQ